MSRGSSSGSIAAVGLDLGSSRIKAGLIDERGLLVRVESAAAPPLSGRGLVREGDGESYLAAARQVLSRAVEGQRRGLPLGLASQRSTILVWDRRSGEARTPMISWQDRRAAEWCEARDLFANEVRRLTGLLLSPHYAGPKLATLLAERDDLRRGLLQGRLLCGNLDAWLLHRCSSTEVHETDLTMAARTTMVDLSTADWSDALLTAYGVPRRALPSVRGSVGRDVRLSDGPVLRASLADQAAGVVATLEPDDDAILITLGTGGFLLRPISGEIPRQPGYLTAPVLSRPDGPTRFVLEGTVNGAGSALDLHPGRTELPADDDPSPDAFCLPDIAGLGAPYWRPKIGLRWSEPASRLDPSATRRTVVEGLLFRLRQVLDGLEADRGRVSRLLLSGGVTAQPGLLEGLATLTGRPVERLTEHEAGIVGVARLAAGLSPRAEVATRRVEPGERGRYLPEKYSRWSGWFESVLETETG